MFDLILTCKLCLGASLGSFIALVIDRVPRGESILWPPSHCSHCQWRLPVWCLIPIISYTILRGRCWQCRARIGATSFWLEILCLCLCLPVTSAAGAIEVGIILCWLIAAGCDYKTMRYPLMLDGVIYGLLWAHNPAQWPWLVGLILAGIVTWRWQHRLTWIGDGDLQFGLVTALQLGLTSLLWILLAASVSALTWVIIRHRRQPALPFLPFLVGASLTLQVGQSLVSYFMPRILDGYHFTV